MADNIKITFGDLQTDERYKKLERSLKLATLKKKSRNNVTNDQTSQSVVSPSISSINADVFDSSYSQFLQTSRVEGELVSSSNNLKNILLKRMNTHSGHKAIATSSVKKYDPNINEQSDHTIMQPPSFSNTVSIAKRQNKVQAHSSHSLHSPERSDNQCLRENTLPSTHKNFFQEVQNYKSCGISKAPEFQKPSVPSQNTIYGCGHKKTRIFTKWRVILTEQGQLIIKGTLECGKVARSKPVTRRLSATSVESIYKHIYYLQGNIVDERGELPNYIRGKFYNGFPDDWENVHQVWQTFVRQGHPLNFRWPTPITDSDDDLKSGITDVTLSYMTEKLKTENIKSIPTKSRETHKSGEIPAEHLSTHLSLAIAEKKDKTSPNLCNLQVHDISTQTNISGTMVNLSYSTERETVTSHTIYNEHNQSEQQNLSFNKENISPKTKKQKDVIDKLNIILRNVTHKNCTLEYINKIIEMFDCLNYFMSYRSMDEGVPMKMQEIQTNLESGKRSTGIPIPWQGNVILPKQNSETACVNVNALDSSCDRKLGCASVSYDTSLSENETAEHAMTLQDNSESEIYAGIPKILAEQMLRQNEVILKRPKRKIRKKLTQSEIKKRKISKANVLRSNNSYTKDASVSITEDEADSCTMKKLNDISHDARQLVMVSQLVNPVLPEERNSIKSKMNPQYNQPDFPKHGSYSEDRDCATSMKFTVQTMNRDTVSSFKRKRLNCSESSKGSSKFYKNKSDPQNGADYEETQKNIQAVCNVTEGSRYINVPSESSVKQNSKKKNQPSGIFESNIIHSLPANSSIRLMNKDPIEDTVIATQISLGINEKKNVKEPVKEMGIDVSKEPVVLSNVNSIQHPSSHTSKKLLNYSSDKLNEKNTSVKPPKLLTAWVPNVIWDLEGDVKCGLVFQGNLLNEAGHVVNRKFTTDIVNQRLTPTLIGTRDNELYQLVGDLHDTKHVVPKELLSQCRYGCPSRIELFCKLWKSNCEAIKSKESGTETPVDDLNIVVSSKGRIIVPPLNYWTGERVILKNNSLVYDPGSTQENITFSIESPKKLSNTNKSKLQREIINKASNSDQQSVINYDKESIVKTKHSLTKFENNSKKLENNKQRPSTTKHKRKITQQLSSSDSDGNENPVARKKLKIKRRKKHSVEETANIDALSAHMPESHVAIEAKKVTRSGKSKSTSDIGTTAPSMNFLKPMTKTRQSVAGRNDHNIICAYYQHIPLKDDTLSDDQTSCI